jgi:flagellar protein FliS
LGARYREMEIRTATPEMVIVKLYEGALRFIRAARSHQEAGYIAGRATSIAKALAIVNELQHSLNLERGGEIARNLDSLYFFVTDRLIEANLRGTVAPLDVAAGILSTLNEAWVEIARRPAELAVGDPVGEAAQAAREKALSIG